jgi:hypothetical protein
MALDGPQDDDAADAFRDADRGFRPERYTDHREVRGRDDVYDELRVRQASELGTSAFDRDDAPERTAGEGWKWKGLELDPAANRIADEGIAARREAEGRDAGGNYEEAGITPDMRRIEAELDHGTLVPDTEKFALKSPDRFKEKLAKLITRYPDHDCGELAAAIHDGIRYTFLLGAEYYTAGVAEISQKLRDQGYDMRMRKPSWDAVDYRGVNSRWMDPERGVQFEVQFHTPESWEAKQKTHDLYERLSDTRTSPRERARLEREQQQVTASIPVPPGALEITYYAKGSRDDRG